MHKIMRRIPTKDAPLVTQVLNDIFIEYEAGSRVFKSITADNGPEFSELALLETKSQIDVYFAHPIASWERGTNERHNGITQ